MSDNNLENEFNSFFGGDNTLFNKLGEEKARKVLNFLKQMLEFDNDNNHVFKSFPFKKMIEKESDSLGEPDEVITTNDNGMVSVKKIWRDSNGKIIKTQVESHINMDEKDDVIPNPKEFDFDYPTSLGLPIIFSVSSSDILPNNLFDLIKSSNTFTKKKKKRTLEELLDKAIEVENYDLAASVKKLIESIPEFNDNFKKDMTQATENKDIDSIKRLTKVYENHKQEIQKLLDMNESLFEN